MIPGFDCPVKSSGASCDTWASEWTYTGTGGEVLLDTNVRADGGAWTDFDPRVPEASQVADSGTAGITNIAFPKCKRARVLHVSLEPAIKQDADYRQAIVTDLDAVAGTGKVIFLNASNAETDPNTSARCRLVLQLEHR